MTAGYSGTPLPRKLGVRPDSRVLVLGAPAGFDPGAPFHRRPGPHPYDVVLLFCPDRETLARRFDSAASRHSVAGMLWVCWPKRTSGVATDLDENVVREHGLAHDRVDVKVAAIDATWSGLKFVNRLRDRGRDRGGSNQGGALVTSGGSTEPAGPWTYTAAQAGSRMIPSCRGKTAADLAHRRCT